MINDEIDAFLKHHTGEISHGKRTLYQHLKGTYQLMREQGRPDYACMAGLFHSIYGTNIFLHQTTNDRRAIIAMIGQRAERLVYIFCSIDRPRALIAEAALDPPYSIERRNGSPEDEDFKLEPRDLYDLLSIELANLMEQNSLSAVPAVREAMRDVQYRE